MRRKRRVLSLDELGSEEIPDGQSEVPEQIAAALKIIRIGKPFKSGLYPGWFVPYEIRLKSSDVRKFNLAIRNDNPKRQWTLDGGI